jgi:DNA-binding MarR family transcriptional regulator
MALTPSCVAVPPRHRKKGKRMNSLHHHPWDVSLDPHTVPVFLWLQWAHRRSLQPMQPALARYGLSSAEFDLLATLRNAEPDYTLTPSQLLAQMLLTSGGLSKVMAQLEARGLIARLCRDDDRRIKPVRLTADGQALIEQAMAETVANAGEWLRGALTAEERNQLIGLLMQLVHTDVTAQ